jgi:origin recognition complex subunit 5
MVKILVNLFESSNGSQIHHDHSDDCASLGPRTLNLLYPKFAETLVAICHTYTNDLRELALLANSQWPIVMRTLLKDNERADLENMERLNLQLHWSRSLGRIKSSLSTHFEALYPRISHMGDCRVSSSLPRNTGSVRDVQELNKIQLWTFATAFLASHNPTRTDLLRFYRSSEERKKKKGGGTRKSRVSKKAPVSERVIAQGTEFQHFFSAFTATEWSFSFQL